MFVDVSGAARRAEPERERAWLAEQRVFVSSVIGDTAEERLAVARVIEDAGARAVWFEEFGRDADAAEAFLAEVDSSSVYVGILGEVYGRLNPPGFSATEAEYLRARAGGRRVFVLVRAEAPGREGHLARFIERVRFSTTTENYNDAEDAARRVRRRLHELAAEALSPWVKLDDVVFRADEVDVGDTAVIRARAGSVAHRLEALRDGFGRRRVRFVHHDRVVEGDVTGVRRRTTSGGVDELTVELSRVQVPQLNPLRAGTSGYSADELVELGMRKLFLGEPLADPMAMMGLAETGIGVDDLRQAFEQSNEIVEAVTALVVAEGLVGSGRARRLLRCSIGPRDRDTRRVEVEWEDPAIYTNAEPDRRRIEGEWRCQ